MTVYVIVQLKITDRAAYDRYQARFFDVFRKFSGWLLSNDRKAGALLRRAAGEGICAERLEQIGGYHNGP